MMTTTTQSTLDSLISELAQQIKSGILPSTIEKRLLNNGAPQAMAQKIARLAEIKAA